MDIRSLIADPRIFLAVAAGTCFAIWPFLSGRSGVEGGAATAVMALIAMVSMTPLVVGQGWPSTTASGWTWLVSAGVVQTLGILAMVTLAGMVVANDPKDLPRFLVLAFTVQACVPVLMQLFSGGMTTTRLVGLVGAPVVIYCLSKG